MIRINQGLKGYFKIEAFKADENGNEIVGSRRICADWFPNLILDNGLDEIASTQLSNTIEWVRVGTGNTPPAAGQTGLDNQVAASDDTQSSNTGVVTSGNRYIWRRDRTRFGEGDAQGNLSEVGVGWSAGVSDTFSRALILDSGENPTTITVLADEFLDVTYELRIYPNVVDVVGTMVMDSITYDWTARPANSDAYDTSFGWNVLRPSDFNGVNSVGVRVSDGPIGDIDNEPSGSNDSRTSVVVAPYVGGSYERTMTATWGLNDGNFAGGIRSLRTTLGWGQWQVEFSAQGTNDTIPKDNTLVLELTFGHSWARATI